MSDGRGAAAGQPRRVGDTIAIGGDYQFRAVTEGPRPQRFWHDTKCWLARKYLAPRPTDRVLDIGCGSGVVAAALADSPVQECVGIDGSADAVAFASGQFRRANLRFERCLVDELALPEGYFDAAVCMELVEHIHAHQGRTLLDSLYRLLRPGGRLLLTTPNYRSAWPVLEWALDRSGKVPHLAGDQHVTFYNHRSLGRLCRDGGWQPIHQHSCCTIAPWAAWASWALAESIRAAEARLPFGTILVHLVQKPLTGHDAGANAGRRAA